MENNLDFATIGASAPDTYDNPILQGSSDLDYQPIPTKPASPAPAAAASGDTQDQAARLRALLSSHLSEGGASNGQATGADRLEALIDMLYAMTAPAETAPSSAPAATVASAAPAEPEAVAAPVTTEEKPATVAESHAITTHPEPVENALISEPFSEPVNVEAAPAPVPALIEAATAQIESPVTHSEAPAALLTETASAPDLHTTPVLTSLVTEPEVTAEVETAPTVTAETQTSPHFAAPEAAVETHPQEAATQEAPQVEVSQEHETLPMLEATTAEPTIEETAAEPTAVEETAVEPTALAAAETFPDSEPHTIHESAAFIADVSEVSPTLSAMGEEVAVEAKSSPRAPVAMAEVLTMDERAALLNPMKEESTKEALTVGGITFNFVTEKSTATLNIPIQPNLSQITFEQRLDEIILKIHLSL